MRTGILLLACALLGTLPALAATAPRVGVASLSDISVPDQPYDEKADANAAVAKAFAQAKAEHKRVLIDLGGNWCADCRILAGVMGLPEVQHFLAAHYVVVSVDVGRFNRNLQIPARFGITQRLEGVPSVLIADPDGRLIDAGHIAALADARSMTPQAIADWLAQWSG
jgi:thiol:disulfide interchange protein